jgi:hypothetical protein
MPQNPVTSVKSNPNVERIQSLLQDIRGTTTSPFTGLERIAGAKKDIQIIESLTSEELSQAAPILRQLKSEIAALQSQVPADLEGYRRATFDVFRAGPSRGFNPIHAAMVENYHSLKTAVDEAISKGPQSGCFVATACYGSYEHPAVVEFRWFRDYIMLRFDSGRRLVDGYYRVSPPVAAWLTKRPGTAAMIRKFVLCPILVVVSYAHRRSRS